MFSVIRISQEKRDGRWVDVGSEVVDEGIDTGFQAYQRQTGLQDQDHSAVFVVRS